MTEQKKEGHGLLGPYRVLDLTQEGCMFCGKVFGDLGADVIKVEPPGGDRSRNIGPFWADVPHPERSIFWCAYNVNKRSITLDITRTDGKDIFKKLVATADFIVESFQPGYLDELGLGYDVLNEVNRRLIVTSITPFGQTGPKARYKSCELTSWASGGQMATMGNPDTSPVWVSFPHAQVNAAFQAATGAMIAHWYRQRSGEGQLVDVSVQEAVTRTLMATTQMWMFNKSRFQRTTASINPVTGVTEQEVFRCKDGYVTAFLHGGALKFVAGGSRRLVEWMNEEGMAPEWLMKFDWSKDYDSSKLTQELVDRYEEYFMKFFETKTKAEIWQEAVERALFVVPQWTVKEIAENKQSAFRELWVNLEQPEVGGVTYLGPIIKAEGQLLQIWRRAPRIGEHNLEVYEGELGFSRQDLTLLKQTNVI